MPFTEKYIQLAFEAFEQSYKSKHLDLAYLSLIISLESLFNQGQGELSETLSRNIGVLLGKSRKESKEIYQEVKNLYKKRSVIIHGGKIGVINLNILLKTRQYVRECIKQIVKIKKK